jgi:tetratricopeptide (TPR) repeat protein
MSRQKRRAAAITMSGASTPAALFARGLAHLQRGQLLEAQVCCQDALATEPAHADSLYLMGLLAIEAGQCDHAVEWLARAIGQSAKAEYVSALGHALQRLGRTDEAVKAFDKALQLDPDDAETAERCGTLLLELGRMEEALACLDLCDKLAPNQAAVLEKRGHVLHILGRPEAALADHRRAHALNPNNPNTCNNIGASLQSRHLHDDALVWFDLAIALKPDFATVLLNKALSLTQLGRISEAIAGLNDATAIDPDNADTQWNLALLQLMTGDFKAGWAGREARWKGSMRPMSYPVFSQPVWRGDADIAGKTILIAEDEGLGDTIQFARYVPMLAARGARVILVVRDALHPLLSGLSGLSQCLPASAGAPAQFDLHCPICSLPHAFGTRLETIPSVVPYLPAPSPHGVQTWEDRLGPRRKLRIGLVWSGNPQHGNDHNRSIPLRTMSGLRSLGADFVSLQKEPGAGDATLLAQAAIVDLTVHLTDFAETAALLACLDLVITVDTSVAHLAGSLGRPTWLLLPHVPDYRWLLNREDSPWYPTMRLFRQDERRDWDVVIEQVRDELAALIAAGA